MGDIPYTLRTKITPPFDVRSAMTGTGSGISLRTADIADAEQIAAIYNHYVIHSAISFEEAAVDPQEIGGRMHDAQAKGLPWIVAEERQAILGYAYATPWRTRSAYRRSVEVTVYVAPERTGNGIGALLYAALLTQLRQSGLHTAVAVIALPNPASVRLHERFRFEKVAHLQQIGYKMGQWVDVGYWQLLL
jgi:phosphinothricin acetyltransferase